jgi:hypothetical protein
MEKKLKSAEFKTKPWSRFRKYENAKFQEAALIGKILYCTTILL